MINKPLSIVDIKNLPEVITLTRDFFPFVAGTKIYKEIVILEKRFISSDILLKYSFSKVEFDGNKGIGHNALNIVFTNVISFSSSLAKTENVL